MRVHVLAVGRLREPGLRAAASMYEKRIGHYFRLEVREISTPSGTKGDPRRVREVEAERIMAAAPPGCELVALTRSGRGMSSRRLATYLEGQMAKNAAAS